MEENENIEPKPGYLGKNLEGHEEAYSPNAWSEIEAKLKSKNRKRAFFWWFSSLGILMIGLTSVLLWMNADQKSKNEPQISKEKTAPIQKENGTNGTIKKSSKEDMDILNNDLNEKDQDYMVSSEAQNKTQTNQETEVEREINSNWAESKKALKPTENQQMDPNLLVGSEGEKESEEINGELKKKMLNNKAISIIESQTLASTNKNGKSKPGKILQSQKRTAKTSEAESISLAIDQLDEMENNSSNQNVDKENKPEQKQVAKTRKRSTNKLANSSGSSSGSSLIVSSDQSQTGKEYPISKQGKKGNSRKGKNNLKNNLLAKKAPTGLKPTSPNTAEQTSKIEKQVAVSQQPVLIDKPIENSTVKEKENQEKAIKEDPIDYVKKANPNLETGLEKPMDNFEKLETAGPIIIDLNKKSPDSSIAKTDSLKSEKRNEKSSQAEIDFKPEPSPKKGFLKKGFWQVSVESGTMTQEASVEQSQDERYKYLRFQLSNSTIGTPILSSLRINYLWQVHSTLALGFRLSYSLVHQKLSTNLEPAKFAPSVYTFGKDSNSVTAVAVNQDPQTVFIRNSHMIDPGFYAQYKPDWSPIGIQLAAQWIGFNVTSEKNLLFGSMYQNLQIHTGLFFPFAKRFQIQVNTFYLKSDDYFLPIPVLSKGNAWVGTLGIGMKW